MLYGQTSIAIFKDTNSYIVTEINQKNDVKKINSYPRWINEGEQIVTFNQFGNKQVFFLCYSLKTNRNGYYDTVVDLHIKDGTKDEVAFSKRNSNNFWVTLNKIIGDTFFFSFNDEKNTTYSISLSNSSDIKKNFNKFSTFTNLWAVDDTLTTFVFTKEDEDEKNCSGIGKFTQEGFNISTMFAFRVIDYKDGYLIGHLANQIFLTNLSLKSERISLNEQIPEKLFSVFFLNSNYILIGRYIEQKDIISNFLFNSSGSIKSKTYVYYKVNFADIKNIKVEKIKDIGKAWNLLSIQNLEKM